MKLHSLVLATLAALLARSVHSQTAEESCEASGGAIGMGDCCLSAADFPDTCMIGACGCGPGSTHNISVCECPEGFCFDGTECMPVDDSGGGNETDLGESCELMGGTIDMAECCLAVSDYPDTCSTGACGCGPGSTHNISVCQCPEGMCFDGTGCVEQGDDMPMMGGAMPETNATASNTTEGSTSSGGDESGNSTEPTSGGEEEATKAPTKSGVDRVGFGSFMCISVVALSASLL